MWNAYDGRHIMAPDLNYVELSMSALRHVMMLCAALLGDQATSTMTWYPTHPHYPNTEPTSPCPILIMPSVQLGSDKYQLWSHWFDSTRQLEPMRPEWRHSFTLQQDETVHCWLDDEICQLDLSNWFLSLPSQVLSIISIWQWLVGSVSGQCD